MKNLLKDKKSPIIIFLLLAVLTLSVIGFNIISDSDEDDSYETGTNTSEEIATSMPEDIPQDQELAEYGEEVSEETEEGNNSGSDNPVTNDPLPTQEENENNLKLFESQYFNVSFLYPPEFTILEDPEQKHIAISQNSDIFMFINVKEESKQIYERRLEIYGTNQDSFFNKITLANGKEVEVYNIGFTTVAEGDECRLIGGEDIFTALLFDDIYFTAIFIKRTECDGSLYYYPDKTYLTSIKKLFNTFERFN